MADTKDIVSGYFNKYKSLREQAKNKIIEDVTHVLYEESCKDIGKDEVDEKITEVSKSQKLVPIYPDSKSFGVSSTLEMEKMLDEVRNVESELKKSNTNWEKIVDAAKKAKDYAIDVARQAQVFSSIRFQKPSANAASSGKTVNQPSAGTLQTVSMNIIHSATSLAGSAMSCFAAEKMRKLPFWLEHELVIHHQIVEKMKELDDVKKLHQESNKDKKLKNYTDSELANIEKQIFWNKENLENYEDISLRQYRGRLKKYLDLSKEDEVRNEVAAVNLIIQLESYHQRRKLTLVEDNIDARLLVNLDKKEITKEAALKIVEKYDDDSLFLGVLKEDLKPKAALRTPTPEQVKRDADIQSKLEVSAVKKRKDAFAKGFLLVSGILALACLILAPIMPIGAPLVIGLAVGAIVAFAIAKALKPNITKTLSDGLQKGKMHFKDEVGFWKAKKNLEVENKLTPESPTPKKG